MEGKKSNKIREIVRLQQLLKKWKKLAANSSKSNNNNVVNSSNSSSNNNNGGGGGNKGIKFLKKTLSFSDNNNHPHSPPSASGDHVPKGYLAVCVGKELKRYVIPTHYLGHQAFAILLREAEEEFGFHQEGVLKIPSDVSVFERILRMVESGSRGSGSRRENNHHHHDHQNYLFADQDHHLFQQYHHQYQDLDVVSNSLSLSGCCSPDCSEHLLQSSHPQLCR